MEVKAAATDSPFDVKASVASPEPIVPIEVSVVIPCLNEAQTIAMCIRKALQSFAALGVRGEVIIADNGSVDDSVNIAEGLGARVVRESKKGYGAALSRGINAARGEIVVMGDADDSYDWSAIAPFIEKMREGFDLVMGNRFQGGIEQGAMPLLHRYLGNPVLSWIGRVAFQTNVGDFHCGMRAFTKTAFRRMCLSSSGMEFATEMVASSACQGLRIGEIPTKLYLDKRNRPPHLRSFRDGWRHLRFILTYAPDYLYLIPGFTLLAAGLLLQGLLIQGPARVFSFPLGIHFLALGSLLTLVGFNILNMGVLAKALMAHRYVGLVSRTTQWIRFRFNLEAGLIVGVFLVLLGIGIDVGIAVEWIRTWGGPMEQTVHLAFAATTTLVLGVNVIFSSFLLHTILLVNSESKWVGSFSESCVDGISQK
jgi:glycosyltransferase involved in cell wall biosynthesis